MWNHLLVRTPQALGQLGMDLEFGRIHGRAEVQHLHLWAREVEEEREPESRREAHLMCRPYTRWMEVGKKTLQRVLLAVKIILTPQLYHGIYRDSR